MAREEMVIAFKSHGARTVRRDIKGLSVGLLGIAFVAKRAGEAFVNVADAMVNVENRTKIFARGTEDAKVRMGDVVKISRELNLGLDAVSEVYGRVALAQDAAGLSTDQVTKVVSNLSKAVLLSGASAQEASGALRQFSQGLAANRLSGQELNSVLEQTPLVAKVLADGMGKAVGQLRSLGEQGLITTKVLTDIFGKEIDVLDEKLRGFKFPLTALLAGLHNEIVLAFAEFDKAAGSADALRGALIDAKTALISWTEQAKNGEGPLVQMGEAIGTVVQFIKDYGTAVLKAGAVYATTKLVGAFVGLIQKADQAKFALLGLNGAVISTSGNFVKAASAIKGLTFAGVIGGITSALAGMSSMAIATGAAIGTGLATPLIAAVAVIGAAAAALYHFRDAEITVGETTTSISEIFEKSWQGMKDLAQSFVEGTVEGFTAIANGAGILASEIGSGIGGAFATFQSIGGGAVAAMIEIFKHFGAFVAVTGSNIRRLWDAVTGVDDSAAVLTFEEALATMDQSVDGISNKLGEFRDQVGEDVGGVLKAVGDTVVKQIETQIKKLQNIRVGYGYTADEQMMMGALGLNLSSYNEQGPKAPPLSGGGAGGAQSLAAAQAALLEGSELVSLDSLLNSALVSDGFNLFASAEGTNPEDAIRDQLDGLKSTLQDYDWTGSMDGLTDATQAAFGQMLEDADSLGETMYSVMNSVASSMSGALEEFSKTGKISFGALAKSAIQDLQAILMKALMVKLVTTALGGLGSAFGSSGSEILGGSPAASGFGDVASGGSLNFDLGGSSFLDSQIGAGIGGFATGGMVQQSQPILVGEKGPEIFTPPSRGMITPNNQLGTQGGGGGGENITIVNVEDRASVFDAMRGTEGEGIIVNAIRRNPDLVRGLG